MDCASIGSPPTACVESTSRLLVSQIPNWGKQDSATFWEMNCY